MRVTTLFSLRGLAVVACATAMTASASSAQQPTQAQPQKEHVVRQGDTLWDLAKSYLNDPFRWPMIYEANRRIVENPHRIFPTERLIIPGVAADPVAEQPAVVVAEAAPTGINRSRFYRAPEVPPAEPTVITSDLQRNAIIQPMEWLAAPWIGDSASLGINGRIINSVDPRASEDKLATTFHPRDEMYISAQGQPGDRLLVIRVSRHIRPYGWLIEPMGVIRIDSVGPRAARAMITHQFADMQVGHLTIPLPTIPQMPTMEPVEIAGGAQGDIIDFLAPQPLYGTTDIGFVDMGAARGINVGDEVLAYIPERQPTKTRPEVLPEEPIARMRVIKVTSSTATVRVTRVHNSGLTAELPVRVSKQQVQ